MRGFCQAMATADIEISNHAIKFTDLSQEDIAQKMSEICSKAGDLPEAILAFNDYVALYAMHWCKQQGISPNRDLVFASYANLPITDYLDNPPVASVEQFAYKMGERAAIMLLETLQKPDVPPVDFQEIILDTELVVHTSG